MTRRFPALALVFLSSFLWTFEPGVTAQTRRALQRGRTAKKATTSRPAPEPVGITPEMRIILGHITANSLKGTVSFLASDLLEGRDTPSRGLDAAGEYIAAQFVRMGLDPAGDDKSYFQTVTLQPDDPNSAKSRNVAAILPGSDPALKDSYVIVSAHYDHLGLAKDGEDRVFNGANDDASGTASVLEVANALAALHPRPKRSILFLLFCGEEKGLKGSKYYVDHPLVPLEKTVAQVNLEQMGRTDAPDGPHVGTANVTGFDYSSMTQALVDAGKRVDVKIVKDAAASDRYFNLSDNASFARAGVPAHTVSVVYEFPDYHAVGDEWQKLDYANMAKVDGAVGIAVLRLAAAPAGPKWNDQIPAVKRYAEAAERLHRE